MAETTILIVEDESIVALDLETHLIQLGYQVIGPTASGSEAVKLVVNQHPDLILMDIHLQGTIDGIAAAQMIQDQFSVPIVYLTAHSDPTTLERAQQTHPHGYLIKPFNERELYTTIEMSLSRHRMEQQILYQNQQLQGVVDAMPQGVALIDQEYRIWSANHLGQDALMKLAGLRIGDKLQQLGDLGLTQLLHQSEARLWHLVSPRAHVDTIFEVALAPQKVDSGWVLIMRDVTQEREIEQRVQQQQRLAAVGQLAAGIAHDFNNILTIISMTLQLMPLRYPDLHLDIQQRLATASEQVERGAGMIQQILDFSRQSNLTTQTFDLVSFIKKLAKLTNHILPENINFAFYHHTDRCLITADPGQVQQVMMNLIINARDAMPHGGQLEFNLQLVSYNTDNIPPFPDMVGKAWVCLTISDSGVGIALDIQERIFEPFFTTKNHDQGTGLGLAQVYGLIRQHDGFIDVESEVGIGTKFMLYWLLSDSPAETAVSAEDTDITTRPQFGNGETLLFVEDDANVRQSTAEILRLLNFQVIEVECGQDALTLLEQPNPVINLVITDMMMPGMTGMELCRAVKGLAPDLEVILLTGYAPEAFMCDLLAAGFAHILEKPFTVEKLVEVIHTILQEASIVTKWVDTQQLAPTRPKEIPLIPLEAGVLHLIVVGIETPIILPGDVALILGRGSGDTISGEALLVDLAPYQAKDLGVSRQHARIQRQGSRYSLEDLSSRNGTHVNGYRLTPREPYTLRPGDCVWVGELILFVYFV